MKYGLEKKIELQREKIRAKQQHQKNLICQTVDQIERFSGLPKKCHQSSKLLVKLTPPPDDIRRLQEALIQKRQQVAKVSSLKI